MASERFYIVTREDWYVERTVWLISGLVSLLSVAGALAVHPAVALLVTVTGLSSLAVAVTGFCPVGTLLLQVGFRSRLAEPASGSRLYRMRTDKWFLERGIYAVVGTNLTLASLLTLVHSPWWLAFIGFVGAASVVFAATGFCPVANVLWWIGLEPRLGPARRTAGACGASPRAPAGA